MVSKRERSISEMIEDTDLMTEAIRQGVRDELLLMARLGHSVPEQHRDGQIVWLSPDQIYERLGITPPAHAKAS